VIALAGVDAAGKGRNTRPPVRFIHHKTSTSTHVRSERDEALTTLSLKAPQPCRPAAGATSDA
jgi:hypothetical protein